MYVLILVAIALTLIIIAICVTFNTVPPPVSKSQELININPSKFEHINSDNNSSVPLGMYNLSVHKNEGGYSGLIRGCTWNGCYKNNIYPVFSYPYHITLDNSGNVSSLNRIDFDYTLFNKCDKSYRDVHANGIEDPKLFKYLGEEWCIGSCLGNNDQHHPCINSMGIFKISDPQNTFKILSPPPGISWLQRQKNWSPFEWNDKLLCEYTIQPHVIIDIDINTGHTKELHRSGTEIENITHGASMRGGAPPILINAPDPIYLGIGHTHPSDSAGYVHFFYTFEADPPFRIINISDIFKMDHMEQIQFAAGLSYYNDSIYISYGVNDCFNRIARYDLAEVLATLTPKTINNTIK